MWSYYFSYFVLIHSVILPIIGSTAFERVPSEQIPAHHSPKSNHTDCSPLSPGKERLRDKFKHAHRPTVCQKWQLNSILAHQTPKQFILNVNNRLGFSFGKNVLRFPVTSQTKLAELKCFGTWSRNL